MSKTLRKYRNFTVSELGGLCWGDKTLRTPAFPAFVDVMHKTRFILFDARKPHLPTAFDAGGFLGKRFRGRIRIHRGILTIRHGTVHETNWTNLGREALRWVGDPHLLAASTFVHAQSPAGSDIWDFVSQPRLGATLLALDLGRFVAWFGMWCLVVGHCSALQKAGALWRLSVTDNCRKTGGDNSPCASNLRLAS